MQFINLRRLAIAQAAALRLCSRSSGTMHREGSSFLANLSSYHHSLLFPIDTRAVLAYSQLPTCPQSASSHTQAMRSPAITLRLRCTASSTATCIAVRWCCRIPIRVSIDRCRRLHSSICFFFTFVLQTSINRLSGRSHALGLVVPAQFAKPFRRMVLRLMIMRIPNPLAVGP